jgi:DNA-directed RNA polymerase specialized sigma24 family protein
MQAEGDIVRLPVEGPQEFRSFFEDEQARLLKTLYFATGNRADAADLMQEAFLRVWERWDRIGEIDVRTDVRTMLLALSPRQRAALVLLDLYGYGSEEAARITDHGHPSVDRPRVGHAGPSRPSNHRRPR